MRDLKTIAAELQALEQEFTDAIAKNYPIGAEVLIQTKRGWEKAKVTWTPERSNGANPLIYVKRLRTGGKHKINLKGVGNVGMVRHPIT